MKKRVMSILIFAIAFLFPMSINAIGLEAKLYCDGTVAKNSRAQCRIKADINGLKLKSYDIEVNVDGTLNTGATTINKGEQDEGADITLGTFSVGSGSETGEGKVYVTLKNIIGIIEDNEQVMSDVPLTASTIRVLSDDNALKSLTINGTSVNAFRPDALNYNDTVNENSVKISAIANHASAKISGLGTKSLTCGKNTFQVKVQAEDSTIRTYQLNLTRNCKSDAKLQNIKLSTGTLTPSFQDSLTSYAVTVTKEIEKITIDYDKKDATQTVTGGGVQTLKYGKNTFVLRSKAENGDTFSYTIVVTREDGRSTNNSLASLELSSGKILFDKDTLSYETKVLYEISKIEVSAVAEDSKAKVEVIGGDNLKVGKNKIIIKVTSEMEEVKQYEINVTRLKQGETLGDNPDIAFLVIDGYSLDFSPMKQNYTLKVEDETSLFISVIMEDETATYIIEGNENLKDGSIITIRTQSLDGSENLYQITIEKDSMLPMILIITAASIVIIIVLVVIVIKLSKKKSKKVKTTIVDEDLLSRVDRQLKSAIPNNQNKYQSINTIQVPKNNENINNQNIQTPKYLEKTAMNQSNPMTSGATENKSNIGMTNNIENQKNSYPRQTITTEETQVNPERQVFNKNIGYSNAVPTQNSRISGMTKEEPTKICSICGHRVSASATVCPYCKRTFSA